MYYENVSYIPFKCKQETHLALQNASTYSADLFTGSLMSDMDCSKTADLLAQLPRDR